MLLDDRIDRAAQLAEADMHGRVGQATPTVGISVALIVRAGQDMAVEHFAVIGKRIDDLARAEIGMMVQRRRGDDGLVITDDVFLQLFQNFPRRGQADAAIAFGQMRVGEMRGGFLIDLEFCSQPIQQLGFVFSFMNALDNLGLLLPRQRAPIRPISWFLRRADHHGAHLVAFNFFPAFALKREAFIIVQLELLAKRQECYFLPVTQVQDQLVALIEGQRALRSARLRDTQMVDGLVESPLLEQRMTLRQALFIEIEAAAHLWRLQRALKEDHFEKSGFQRVCQDGRMMLGLCVPDRVELGFQFGAVGIEIVFGAGAVRVRLQPRPHRLAIGLAHGEELAIGASTSFRHGSVQSLHSCGDLAFIGILAVSLAIGFKAAPLVQVKERASDFAGGQGFVQRLYTQDIRIVDFQRLAFRLVGRHQPRVDHLGQQHSAPPPRASTRRENWYRDQGQVGIA